MYRERTLGESVRSLSNIFPVLLVTGPRQVGKSTLLDHCADSERRHVTLDDLDQRELALKDPSLFLQRHPAPLTIDEVQYAPNLFTQIKIAVDRAMRPGMYWLTGSQKFHLMRGITESLAGRVAILDLLGFSQAETEQRDHVTTPFLPTAEWLRQAESAQRGKKTLIELYSRIWLGSFPRVALTGRSARDVFYSSYLQTYIQRDVRALARVGDEMAFHRLLRATAARTGQLINFADIARDVGVDQKTVKSWISILETSGIIYLLQPYHNNVIKRAIKTPKLYFLDTGLCAYLTQWSSPETLEAGAMSGAILETWVLSEILKSYWHRAQQAYFYSFRDKDGKEVDLLIEQDNRLHPVEIKKNASPSMAAAKGFAGLKLQGRDIGPGAVICLRESPVALDHEVTAIPAAYL